MMLHAALLALCGSFLPADDEAVDFPWHELTLDNGIRVIVFEAPLAEQQAFFTLLPLGLLDDEADKTQFAHLVEHMIVRSTDPDALEADGVVFNGETTALALRLESFTETPNWEEALLKHVAWLKAQDVDPEVLAREKANIALEEQSTAANGFTHKWALAAWNQVVRQGTSHVGLHSDIAGVTVDEARDYMHRRLRSGPGVLFVAVGPVSFDEIATKARATLGKLPGDAWAASAPGVSTADILAVGDREATWDLGARHYMEWYPVPAASKMDRVHADALALVLNRKLQQRGALTAMGVTALAQADLATPEGRWVLLSASVPLGIEVDEVRKELNDVRASVIAGRDVEFLIQQMAGQLTELPDFAAVREQVGDHPAGRWIEAQQMLFMLYAQINMGLSRREVVATYPQLKAADLISFADQVLTDDNRSTLLLEPSL